MKEGELFMPFAPNTRSRSWMVTIQVANMENAGLTKEEYENAELLANFMIETWEHSGKDRTAGISVCRSKEGLYHCHMACYGNTTTLKKVSDILYKSHVEPQLGGKEALKQYLLKENKYAEKEEKILFTMGMETIQDTQGKRNDLEEIERLLKEGSTPEQIFDSSFRYRKFEKMIKAEYIHNRIKSTPIIKKNLRRIWIVGDSGTGKSHFYTELAKEVGIENIYFATDFENGGLDYYIENGAPEILFLDEFKGNMKFSQLLVLLDKYSRAQLHCRYSNCFCLWTTVVITSVFPPDEVYTYMVDDAKKKRDRVEQLLRRLDEIWYKYKENGVYKTYKIPAEEYINYDDLKSRASKDGFVPVDEYENIPFDS